jgi:hypothetical protein
LFDACASWWTQGIGHGNIAMSQSLARSAATFGHVMFPSNLHLPGTELAAWMLQNGPGRGWAARVFYSDDGSTAMEVAVKMAMRLGDQRRQGALNANTSTDPLGIYRCMHASFPDGLLCIYSQGCSGTVTSRLLPWRHSRYDEPHQSVLLQSVTASLV